MRSKRPTTRTLSSFLSAHVDESIFGEAEDGENKLLSVIEQIKCTLTDLLNSEGVKDDTRYRMWVQTRLMNTEKELRGFRTANCERMGSESNPENLCPTPYVMSTVTVAISRDHRELADYYKKVLNAPDNDTATRWQNQFVWALTRHLVAEELVLYPAFEDILGERGRIIVDRGQLEHQSMKEKLNSFQSLEAGTAEFMPALKSLMDDLAQCINEEEMVDLPALDRSLSSEQSDDLERSFHRTKSLAPSRSHPVALNTPFLGTVAWILVAAPFDQLGDLFRKFPDETSSKLPSGLCRSVLPPSHGLGEKSEGSRDPRNNVGVREEIH
ncbi:hypothetical protein O988_06862 [Pseudogymnoascus sp. VKM F-3808]|nr:hypothetical protein O988_06862 [Pseudogymnoascus sp. VKM F-3808]